jgi:DNA topoisomerase-3
MRVAERLYMQGYISYPRTETSKLPADTDLREMLGPHCSHPYWGNYVSSLLSEGVPKVR